MNNNDFLQTYNEYQKLTQYDIDLEKFNHYAIVHHSNSIEGSTLTLDETILLLDENLTPKNKPVEHTLMALDHLKALKYVVALAKEKQPLTANIVKQISAIVNKNTGKIHTNILGVTDTAKGDYRLFRARAGQSIFKMEDIAENMEKLISKINHNINDVKNPIDINYLAFESHFDLVSIHPFGDGNGRTSRLLQNYIQQYHNLPLTYIFEEDKSDYYNALVQARKQDNKDVFCDFMFSQAIKIMKKEIEKIKLEEAKDIQIEPERKRGFRR